MQTTGKGDIQPTAFFAKEKSAFVPILTQVITENDADHPPSVLITKKEIENQGAEVKVCSLVYCIMKTTRYTSGSKKPMAINKQPCYNIGAVCQLHE